MSESHSGDEKRIDSKPDRVERSYHSLPWDWAYLGSHQDVPEGYTRFYAEQVCVEYRLQPDPQSPTRVDYRERTTLVVLYRNPETDEAVVRTRTAASIDTDQQSVRVPFPREGDGPGEWARIQYSTLEPEATTGIGVVPKTVFRGCPSNFRASIAVSPSETRVGEEAEA